MASLNFSVHYFEKAFDTVWRDGLWYKLLMCNIKGKMYNVILNLYDNIKSRIVYNDSVSNVFPCLNGVKTRRKFISVSVRIIS